MIDVVKKAISAAEELGTIKNMDILDYGDNRKMVFFEGVTPEGEPFELDLKFGISKSEEVDEK